jgi:hypothetical protein
MKLTYFHLEQKTLGVVYFEGYTKETKLDYGYASWTRLECGLTKGL